jgi:hypothetical protein
MSEYEKSKKARRVAAVVYLMVMTFVVGGTYLSQRQKQASNKPNSMMQQNSNVAGLSSGKEMDSRYKF